MGCEIKNKNGKLIGTISDSDDGGDFLIIDNKKVPLDEVYGNDSLKKSFNDSIKSSNDIEDKNDTGDNQ